MEVLSQVVGSIRAPLESAHLGTRWPQHPVPSESLRSLCISRGNRLATLWGSRPTFSDGQTSSRGGWTLLAGTKNCTECSGLEDPGLEPQVSAVATAGTRLDVLEHLEQPPLAGVRLPPGLLRTRLANCRGATAARATELQAKERHLHSL